MKKTFVLDTNVLLQTPLAIEAFADNNIVIPEVVLEELDKFKKDNSELGANARHVARLMDKLRQKGNLRKGVLLDGGGQLRIEINHNNVEIPRSWDNNNNDNRILKVCKGLKEKGEKVILVSKDIFVRIKADVIHITAQDFFAEQVPDYNDQYSGICNVYCDDENINKFYETGCIQRDLVYEYDNNFNKIKVNNMVINQFVIIHSPDNEKHTALGRYDGENIVSLKYLNIQPFGVTPRNVAQKFMQEALMENADKAPLVIIKGPAGTAKTFYSIAVGLHKMLCEPYKVYRKILVCRPNVKLDEDIGFLPGSEEEKIAPFMRPIIDNLEVLFENNKNQFLTDVELKCKIDELFERNIITTEAIAFIRGRSIARQWVIIDEAQNLTPRQVKGIITRAGIDTKIILVGDPEQIDHPYLDSRTNGLSYAAEKMKGSELCYQITLNEKYCERSKLAYESSKKM